jgi:hypothetical protein
MLKHAKVNMGKKWKNQTFKVLLNFDKIAIELIVRISQELLRDRIARQTREANLDCCRCSEKSCGFDSDGRCVVMREYIENLEGNNA